MNQKHLTTMGEAWFRFYAELNDCLPAEIRGRQVALHFDVSGSVKDFIESFGVPHTEVDLVLVGGDSVDFSHIVRNGDYVSVYPVFESFDISSISRVRAEPLRALSFVLDVHLGRLAGYLRMAGFDAMYRKEDPDAGLAEIAAREQRVLLTRDRHLLMRGDVTRGYWVRSAEPKHQLVEVLRRFDLASSMKPFTRCMECNTVLEAASRESRLERLPPGAAENNSNRCPTCGRIYWEGSHHMRMKEFLDSIQAEILRS